MTLNFKTVSLFTVVIASAFLNNSMAQVPDLLPIERTIVFSPGDYDSKYYRIPAIATTNDGNLIAVADKRIDNIYDLPNKIDVVGRMSTDNGRTWGDFFTIAEHDKNGGYGDPAIVVDRKTGDILVISSHGNGLWQDSPAHISVSRSKDGGKTWERPVDINPQILTTKPNGKQPIKCISAFASSGGALQLSDGRIMFVLVVREKDNPKFKCYAIYSDDGGKNWQVSKNPGSYDGDESKVVELTDGTLIMSIRNRYKGNRYFSYSKDRGETWSDMEPVADLIEPACNGDIIHYNMDGKDILIQSLPDSPKGRVNVSTYVSEDNGATWPYKRKIVNGPSSYSAMTILPDGSIGMLSEEGLASGDGLRIWFTRIPVDYLMKK